MPSPIAHLAAGYGTYYLLKRDPKADAVPSLRELRKPIVWLWLAASILPDIDSIAGIVMRNFGRFHNQGTHSLLAGFGFAVSIGTLLSWKKPKLRGSFIVTILFGFWLHILMDAFSIGRVVQLLWPSTQRFSSPFPLFYGLRWSDSLWSIHHIWTILTEAGFAIIFLTVCYQLKNAFGRTKRES